MKAISPLAEAAREETLPERLVMLGESTDVAVRRALAQNQHTPSTTLELLSHSSDKATRKNVVLNPNTPTNVLLKLAPQFPRFFFKNPAFDWLLLEDPELLINLGQGVLKNILKTSECPESFMRWAVEFGGEEEKLAVAMNANAPVQCLQELMKCYGVVGSAALGHSKMFPASDTLSMEDVFLTELKAHLHRLSCTDAEALLEKNFIDLPQLPFLNSAVRVDLSESHANPQISVECYLNEVDSPDPSELMSFLWWCYSKYEFESFPPKLEEIKAVRPDYFQMEHVQLLIEVAESRLETLFRRPDDAFVWRETRALAYLFSCMPPEAAFPDRVYRLLSKCCLKSESARSDLLEVCRTAVRHRNCPAWFTEGIPDPQTTHDSFKSALPNILVESVISCLHSLKICWLKNDKKEYELHKKVFGEAIGNSAHLRLSNFKSDDVERIFVATFDLYALLDQQIAGWDEQETSDLRQWVIEVVWSVFQNAACPRELLVEITRQKDKRFAGLIGLAESVLDVRLVIFEPKSSDWFLKRQRRTRDLTVAPAVDAGNVLFIRDSKAQKACNSKSLIARVLGLSHRLVEPKVLAKRCKSLYWIERLAIARNPNTPLNILEVLNRDANVLVSRQAELSKNRFRNLDPKALTRDSTEVSTVGQPVVQVGFIGKELELASPCPNCGGRIVFFEPDETEKAGFTCKGTAQTEEGCGFAVRKIIAKRAFSPDEVDSLVRDKRLGPLDGFRSKAGWPFVTTIVIKLDEETKKYKLEFDFGDDKAVEESGEIINFSSKESLGSCPKCGGAVFEHGKNYVCEKSVSTLAQTVPDCDFKCSQIILRQPIFHDQLRKLLETGKSDVLDKFVSIRSGKSFKAMLTWDAEAGKINFEFLPQSFHPALSIPKKRRLRPPMQFLRNTQLT